MGEERVVEIPRGVAPALAKLVLGALLIAAGGLWASDATGPGMKLAGAIGLGGLGLVVSIGALQVAIQRPPWLRASTAGLWFGGGPIIRWSEIAAMYCMPVSSKIHLCTLAIAFRHKRTVLRLPMSCWLTTIAAGEVQIAPNLYDGGIAAAFAHLEAIRTTACGVEDGVTAGTTTPPLARVVRG